MDPTPELADALFREEVLAARATPPGEKLLAGPRLFGQVCRRMRAGIVAQFPQATDEEVERLLDERLAIARRIENTGLSEEQMQALIDSMRRRP